jgi:methionyl-tRNA formyltransferase
MKKFLFVGNRKFVLEELVKKNLDLTVVIIKNSHLEKEFKKFKLKKFYLISNKYQLLKLLKKINFDVLISNGCPFKIPINIFKNKTLINVHPSYLPDLKGIDPVIGSIIFKRDAGATAHIMNDKFDSGKIISRKKIIYSDDLDATLLYQLSFLAEKEVINEAFKKKFKASIYQPLGKWINYKRSEKDKVIDLSENIYSIIQKIKAFNNLSQGSFFSVLRKKFKVYRAEILHNLYIKNYIRNFNNHQVVLVGENFIIFKKDNLPIKFSEIKGDIKYIKVKSYIR